MDRDLMRLLKKAEEQYDQGCKLAWTVDAVHDYRVAIRRTRAYLKFWQAEAPGKARRLRDRLSGLQIQTALVREWDVFLEQYGEALTDRSVEKGEFARFLQIHGWREMREIWSDLIRIGEQLKGKPPKDLQDELKRQVMKELEAKELDWHRLRIRIKRVRYELERQSKKDKEMIQFLKAWQDRLGLIQDADTHEKWFAWLSEEESLASLGNAAMKANLIEEARQALPELFGKFK